MNPEYNACVSTCISYTKQVFALGVNILAHMDMKWLNSKPQKGEGGQFSSHLLQPGGWL